MPTRTSAGKGMRTYRRFFQKGLTPPALHVVITGALGHGYSPLALTYTARGVDTTFTDSTDRVWDVNAFLFGAACQFLRLLCKSARIPVTLMSANHPDYAHRFGAKYHDKLVSDCFPQVGVHGSSALSHLLQKTASLEAEVLLFTTTSTTFRTSLSLFVDHPKPGI
jgi:hypothetical protein